MNSKVLCLLIVILGLVYATKAVNPTLEDMALQEVTEALDQDLLEGKPVPEFMPESMSFLESSAVAEVEVDTEADAEADADADMEEEQDQPDVQAEVELPEQSLMEAGADADMDAAAAVDADLEAEMQADAQEEAKFNTDDDALSRYYFFDDHDVEAEPIAQQAIANASQAVNNTLQFLNPGKTAETATQARDQAAGTNATVTGTTGKGNSLKRRVVFNETGAAEWANRRRYSRTDADLDGVDEINIDKKLDKAKNALDRLLAKPDLELYESDEDKGLYFGPNKADRKKRLRMIRKALEDSKGQAKKMHDLAKAAKKAAGKPLSELRVGNGTNTTAVYANGTAATAAATATATPVKN